MGTDIKSSKNVSLDVKSKSTIPRMNSRVVSFEAGRGEEKLIAPNTSLEVAPLPDPDPGFATARLQLVIGSSTSPRLILLTSSSSALENSDELAFDFLR
ncbi:hypothetical protein AVEN_160866-1 [Araneus ventricosus]|uniref:Uncharacterized protein n=1 Tax=Araneus ventricosus TaxID=182803 RepID=A0A4Y2NDB7_ARAVE|nr:hypothetical protein AVEN_160866-1 [Araneus ventricosus]